MTRLTLTIDEKILEEAKSLLNTNTKRDTIETALKEVIKQIRRNKALENCGQIELELTQKELEQYRVKE
jgi:Arc/MetJ family transcription regulator